MPAYRPCLGATNVRKYLSGLTVGAGNNAAFREWGNELDRNLVLAGLVQTADTGQVDWATAVFPGANNTAGGYTVWRFNDVLQPNAPIYFKLEYGRGASATTPQMWITVGTGTDGAGTITNIFFPRQVIGVGQSVPTSNYPLLTFISVQNGFFGLAWKCSADPAYTSTLTQTALAAVFIARSTDATGNATTLGATMLTASAGGNNPLQQIARRFVAVSATYGPHNIAAQALSQGYADYPIVSGLYPGVATGLGGSGRSYQDENGDYTTRLRVYPVWTMYPRVQSLSQVCAVMQTDLLMGAEFYATLKGNRPRRYVVVGGRAQGNDSNGFTRSVLAMLWE